MRSGPTARGRLNILAGIVVLGTLVPIAWAQTKRTPGLRVPPGTEGPLEAGIRQGIAGLIAVSLGVAVLTLVVIAVADAIDGRRERADDAVRLQAQIADALRRERTLADLPVRAAVHRPGWGRSPARIELGGQVPTADLRRLVLYVAEQEAARSLAAFHIDDRIAVVPSVRARAA